MPKNDIKKTNSDQGSADHLVPIEIEQQYQPIQPRVASGNAPVLIEIICERVHCVLYDYAINTVDMIVEKYGDKVDIQTVINQGSMGNAKRYLELCERAGRLLSVPAILINGEVVFNSVPHPSELNEAIETVLARQK